MSDILINGAVALVTSVVTAYITSRLQNRADMNAWKRDFALQYAKAAADSKQQAQGLAQQFAIGVLIAEMPDGREKFFIPPNCRLVCGRSPAADISLSLPELSRQHFSLVANDREVRVEDLGSANGTLVNGERVSDARLLTDFDRIQVGSLSLEFCSLPG